jgi:V-type H+-transporting ATPase subunit D
VTSATDATDPIRTQRFRAILAKISEAKLKMGRVMQLAAFSLAEVTYATGDIGYMIQESVTEASFRVQAKQENVSGTILPAFEVVRSGGGEGGSAQGTNGGALARVDLPPEACSRADGPTSQVSA